MYKDRYLKNPFIFGFTIAVLSVVINLVIASVVEGSLRGGLEVLSDNGLFTILIPISIGIEMFLFRYHRNVVHSCGIAKSEKIGISGSVTSSGSMLLCCLHHITDILPSIGFLISITSFFNDFKVVFIMLGLIINSIISLYMLYIILQDRNIIKRQSMNQHFSPD